jgi:hypothetical protein
MKGHIYLVILWIGSLVAFGSVHEPAVLLLCACAIILFGGAKDLPALAAQNLFFLMAGSLACSLIVLIPLPVETRCFFQPGLCERLVLSAEASGTGGHAMALRPYEAARGIAVGFSFLVVAWWVSARAESERDGLLRWLVYGAVACSVVGIAHRIWGASSIWGANVGEGLSFLAPFVNANHAGILAAAVLPLISLFRTRVAIPMLLIQCTTVWLSGSRGAMLVAVVGGAVLVLQRYRRAGLPALIGFLLFIGLFVQSAWFSVFTKWLDPAFGHRAYQVADVSTGRAEIYETTVQALFGVPWFGVGFGGFGPLFDAVKPLGRYSYVSHAHSEPLQWLVEVGLIPTLGVFVAAYLFMRILRTQTRPAVVAAFMALSTGAMIDFPLRSGALLLLWFILLGVVMPMTSNKSGVMGRYLALLAIVVCGLVWLQPRMPDTVTSQNAQLSLAVEPLNAQSWLRYAAAAGEQSDQVQVTKRLLQTTTISPSNPWAWLALARQYARQGLDDKAALAWRNFLTVPLGERQKDYIEEALDVGVQAIPEVAPVMCMAATTLARRDRRLDASLLFLQASERMPSCADSHGRWLARWKLPDMALQVTEERASCLALKVRGRAYRQLNQLTDAAKAYALASDVCDHDDPTLSAERAALIAE